MCADSIPDGQSPHSTVPPPDFHGRRGFYVYWFCGADGAEAEHEYGISLVREPAQDAYDAVLLAVPHHEYAEMAATELHAFLKDDGVLFDLKGVLPLGEANLRL